MTKIQAISDDANQLFTLVLPNGETMTLTMVFKPLQIGWFCGVTYQNFSVSNLRVGNSLNILSQFTNLLPFGLACFTNAGQDPLFQKDFTAGNAVLCLLDEADLASVGAYLASKV